MSYKIQLFGMLAEAVGKDEVTLEGLKIETIQELENLLFEEFSELQNLTFSWAVNQSLATKTMKINSSKEIALLPPFAGG